ncbi:MAG TPA: TetR/AcrR family transcriptional regulator, partial [Myxococcota bacterium]|nr:TetR/AcrR family transcriptional regulator [Myxococcota bacterium]
MARIRADQREAHEQARRTQILEAALRIWVREGYHRAPVEAIAREAGVAKGTIYLYFPTKEAVLQAAIERFSLLPALEELVAKLHEIPPERAVPALVETLWHRLRDRGPLIATLLGGGMLLPENGRVFLERVVIPGNQLLAEYLDRCVARGALRPLDTFVAARALVGCLVMFLIS